MIEVDRLTYAYPNNPLVFKDFDWSIQSAEAWAILGPSGCGKTTLLYLLAGLRFPNHGQIRIDGQPLVRPRPYTGLILQDYGLLPWATVRENAELGLRVRSFYGPDGKHAPSTQQLPIQVIPWLERLGISDLQNQYPGQISGGQRQRAAIARTLALQPDLLLMDEPFSSLDAPTRESLQNLMLELKAEQKLTLLVVTHAIEEALALGQKILLLSKPPNTQAVIITNPCLGQPGFRSSSEYLALYQELRGRMDMLG